ncbi:kinase-like protein, partial [Rhizophagus irregularis]
GVLPFMAPEVLRGRKHTKASDIYGFGMVMYELLTGKPPFFGERQDLGLITAIIEGNRPHVPRYTPQFYKELMEQCWDSPMKFSIK